MLYYYIIQKIPLSGYIIILTLIYICTGIKDFSNLLDADLDINIGYNFLYISL